MWITHSKNELLMKETIFMRILFCKINCPFICFCKPSAAHLYTSGKLKLENAPHVPSTDFTVSDTTDDNVTGGTTKVKNVRLNGKLDAEYVPKSCIKKPSSGHDASNEIEKKKVQWKDNLGKELAEIKEFESSIALSRNKYEERRIMDCRKCQHLLNQDLGRRIYLPVLPSDSTPTSFKSRFGYSFSPVSN